MKKRKRKRKRESVRGSLFEKKLEKKTQKKGKTPFPYRNQLGLGLRRGQRRQHRGGSSGGAGDPRAVRARGVLPRGGGPGGGRERQRALLPGREVVKRLASCSLNRRVRHRLRELPQAHPRRVDDDVVVGGAAGPSPGVGLELGAGDDLVAAGAEDAGRGALLFVGIGVFAGGRGGAFLPPADASPSRRSSSSSSPRLLGGVLLLRNNELLPGGRDPHFATEQDVAARRPVGDARSVGQRPGLAEREKPLVLARVALPARRRGAPARGGGGCVDVDAVLLLNRSKARRGRRVGRVLVGHDARRRLR